MTRGVALFALAINGLARRVGESTATRPLFYAGDPTIVGPTSEVAKAVTMLRDEWYRFFVNEHTTAIYNPNCAEQ